MQAIEILWTGGYDSSFRVSQLSKIDCVIQPYYLKDNRKSELRELSAIETISAMIRKRVQTKCTLQPLVTMNTSDVREDKGITDAFQEILKDQYLGSQYEWLARFALDHPGLELCIHKSGDHAENIIFKNGKVAKVVDHEIEYFIVDKEKSKDVLFTLFGNYHLPLWNVSKLDMKREYQRQEMGLIADLTWFCHTPIADKPCGKCEPCRLTIESGLAERFSDDSLKRYRKFKQENREKKIKDLLRPYYRNLKKILRIPR